MHDIVFHQGLFGSSVRFDLDPLDPSKFYVGDLIGVRQSPGGVTMAIIVVPSGHVRERQISSIVFNAKANAFATQAPSVPA